MPGDGPRRHGERRLTYSQQISIMDDGSLTLTDAQYAQANVGKPSYRYNGIIPSEAGGCKVSSVVSQSDKGGFENDEEGTDGNKLVPLILVEVLFVYRHGNVGER